MLPRALAVPPTTSTQPSSTSPAVETNAGNHAAQPELDIGLLSVPVAAVPVHVSLADYKSAIYKAHHAAVQLTNAVQADAPDIKTLILSYQRTVHEASNAADAFINTPRTVWRPRGMENVVSTATHFHRAYTALADAMTHLNDQPVGSAERKKAESALATTRCVFIKAIRCAHHSVTTDGITETITQPAAETSCP